MKLDRDRCLSEIGTHWEVRDRGDQGDGSCDIVENAMRTRLGEGQTDYGQCWDEHNSTNGLVMPTVRDAVPHLKLERKKHVNVQNTNSSHGW